MDHEKIGSLIRALRTEREMTQARLAEQLGVSNKTVSKWERGLGAPDLSLLPDLSRLLGVDLERLLAGDLGENEAWRGSMKRLNFYICPQCGNILTATAEAAVSCCGKKLAPAQPVKAEEPLRVETVENEYYVTSSHPMEKGHYIAFTALLTGDTLFLRKHYPEWDLQSRIPAFGHGKLFWYCTRHGLFYQLI